jgi:hypothetical protein
MLTRHIADGVVIVLVEAIFIVFNVLQICGTKG